MLYSLDGREAVLPPPDADGAPQHWIAPSAAVIGDVTLHEDASVWFGAVLRGDNERITIGKGSNVQDNSVMHTDPGCPLTIGENVTIGHKCILHGCTVEDGALIGQGAIVMNKAVIGAGSLVGAGALIPEGKIFPPRSLIIGAPASVKRALDDKAVAGILMSARVYIANWRRFAAGMKPDPRG